MRPVSRTAAIATAVAALTVLIAAAVSAAGPVSAVRPVSVVRQVSLVRPAMPPAPEPAAPRARVQTPASDDTAAVCAASAKTVDDGLNAFMGQIEKVTDAADHGDLANTDAYVKDAGTSLVDLSNEVRRHATEADAQTVKSTLGALADEFERQGGSLNSLGALQRFDVTRIHELAQRMVVICDAAASAATPSTGAAPGASASPAASPSPS